ncbi:hypothetical protein BGZ46_007777 [Entomortierella lignicola]|nr:hypothetical protein BGZ46_007777 [Entomortierella lignicola]
MPFVESLESYSRALYLPLRGYVRRPFQFITEAIRDHVPKGLWDMRRAMEHTARGTSRLIGPFNGLQFGLASESGSNPVNNVINSMTSNRGSIAQGSGSVNGSISAAIGVNSGAGGVTSSKLMQTQPSMIHFFTSPYFLLLCFMSIVMNRINAIVAPRNPHPLKLSVRFALKIPAFYLLMKSALITIALLIQDQPTFPLAWIFSDIKTTYNESHALWLSFIAMGVTCTSDSFIANLHSIIPTEQTTNMLEWAIQFHFTPSGRDVLIISLNQICQLLTLQILSLSPRGKNYRLIATTFWAMLDLSHFAHAVYYRSDTYPSLQLLSKLPEVVVLLMVCISMVLHALTYIVTGGNVRRQMFEPRVMPTMDEEYTLAVFKLGRACMEATRGVGFRNEIDSVILPFGTILDRKRTGKSRSSSRGSGDQSQNGQSFFSLASGSGNANRNMPSGFSNEMTDSVEMPGQRQQISRRRNRMIAMKAFCQSSANLMIELAYGAYNKIVPVRYRRARQLRRISELGARMSAQDLVQIRATIEFALERANTLRQRKENFEAERYREAAMLDEEEEEELYNKFLSRDLTDSDDEDEDFDVDYIAQGESEDEDEEFEMGTENSISMELEQEIGIEEQESYGIRRRIHSDGDSDDDVFYSTEGDLPDQRPSSGWRSWASLQDFFLDTSFMSIFLSSRLQDTPLTRSQYRLTMNGMREFQQDSINCNDEGGSSNAGTSSGSPSRKNKSRSTDSDTKVLLTVLNKYRKSIGNNPLEPTAGSAGSSSNTSPPPLAQPSVASNESPLHDRMLCVVCQSEPRGILLRPCRCLALCNECREVLASRRFKQCPCCRSDVQGFSKIYIP